ISAGDRHSAERHARRLVYVEDRAAEGAAESPAEADPSPEPARSRYDEVLGDGDGQILQERTRAHVDGVARLGNIDGVADRPARIHSAARVVRRVVPRELDVQRAGRREAGRDMKQRRSADAEDDGPET